MLIYAGSLTVTVQLIRSNLSLELQSGMWCCYYQSSFFLVLIGTIMCICRLVTMLFNFTKSQSYTISLITMQSSPNSHDLELFRDSINLHSLIFMSGKKFVGDDFKPVLILILLCSLFLASTKMASISDKHISV